MTDHTEPHQGIPLEIDKSALAHIRCIVCDNVRKERFRLKYRKERFAVVECLDCTFCFIPPHYRKSIDYTAYKPIEAVREVARANLWIKMQRHRLRFRLIRKYRKAGALYDIGCGFGHFLLTGKELGYSVKGVEMSRANIAFVRDELGIDVEENNFLNVREDKEYDIMTLWDVLEHIDDGDHIVQKAFRMLKAGGYLFIQVPQIDSVLARLLKEKWSMLSLDHVNYFSKKTMARLLSQHGFVVKRMKSSIELKHILLYVVLPFLKRKQKRKEDWTVSERQRAFNRLTDRPVWIQKCMIVFHNAIYTTLSALSIGEEMVVVAQKPHHSSRSFDHLPAEN